LQAVSGGADGPLLPEYDDLVIAGANDAWIHSSLSLGWLQRGPCLAPCAAFSSGIGQRWRPDEFDGGITEAEYSLDVAPFDRAKDVDHQLDVLSGAHDLVLSSFEEGTPCGKHPDCRPP
jgi:hypothetical protein